MQRKRVKKGKTQIRKIFRDQKKQRSSEYFSLEYTLQICLNREYYIKNYIEKLHSKIFFPIFDVLNSGTPNSPNGDIARQNRHAQGSTFDILEDI